MREKRKTWPKIPEVLEKVVTYGRTYEDELPMWYPVNSINPTECVPHYDVPGGGRTSEKFMELKPAIKKCLDHLNQHIERIESLKTKLEKAYDEL